MATIRARIRPLSVTLLLTSVLLFAGCGDDAAAPEANGGTSGDPGASAAAGAGDATPGPTGPSAPGADDGEDPRQIPGPAPAPEPRPATDQDPPVANPAEIDKRIATFALQAMDGPAFDLAKSAYGREEALAAVRRAATAFGVEAEAFDLGAKLDDLPGLKGEDDEVDPDQRLAFVQAAGTDFGLVASEEQAEGLVSLDDVLGWILAGGEKPLVFVAWSPKCPTSRKLNDRILEMAQETGIRLYAVAGNHGDTVEMFKKFRDNYGWPAPILLDPGLTVTTLLGGTRTPHFMVVDPTGVLRYRGALDNDVQDIFEGDEREDWLPDALAAIAAGGEVSVTETEPFG